MYMKCSMPCFGIQQTNVNGNERAENGALSPSAHFRNIDFHRFSIIVLFGVEEKPTKIKLRLLRWRTVENKLETYREIHICDLVYSGYQFNNIEQNIVVASYVILCCEFSVSKLFHQISSAILM